MIWSFSASKSFFKCQRQWYFKKYFARPKATKLPLRKEAYFLSKLDSVFAWRGKIVDKIIADEIISPLNFGRKLNQQYILRQARDLFERQLAFAKTNYLRDAEIVISQAGDNFAGLRDIEYEGKVSQDLIIRAWNDVETALLNLFAMEKLMEKLSIASGRIAQRNLSFMFNSFGSKSITVKATPDLITFFQNEPPLIVDWKVHSFGKIDYRLQLACYAMALTRCKPHKDFPATLFEYGTTDIDLLEVQLLTGQQRSYTLTEEDIYELEAYIAETANLMELALRTQEEEVLTPLDFPVTHYPETCESCPFKKICWENTKWEQDSPREWKQMSLF